MKKIKNILIFVLFTVVFASAAFGCSLIKKPTDEADAQAHDLSECRIECTPNTVTYDGTEKKVKIRVLSADDKLLDTFDPESGSNNLTAVYSNNINAGTATVVASPKPGTNKFKGQATGHFTIEPAVADVYDEQTLIEYLSDGNHRTVNVKNFIEAQADLTVPEGVLLRLDEYKLTCLGGLDVKGHVSISDYDLLGVSGDLDIDGRLTVCGSVYVNGAVHNNGTIESFTGSAKLYVDGAADGNGIYKDVELFRRSPLSRCEILIDESDTDYTGKNVTPPVTVKLDGKVVDPSEYSVIYSNNVEPGAASVKICGHALSEKVCGEVTLPFTVNRAAKTVLTQTELSRALRDEHYDRVYIDDNISPLNGLNIPQGYTVYINTDRTCSIKNADIRGALVINGIAEFYRDAPADAFSVTGKIINNGELFISAAPDESAKIENDGGLFVDDNIVRSFNVVGTPATARVPLTDDMLRVEKTAGAYTGSSHYPKITVDAQDEPYFYLSYKYRVSNKVVSSPVDAGDIDVTVKANRFSKRYYGSAQTAYGITRISVFVSNVDDLVQSCAPNESTGVISNYDVVTANFDCVLPSDFGLGAGCELVVPDGKKMTFTDELSIYTTAKLTVNGTFAQNGKMTVGGRLLNNGKCYFNDDVPENVTGGGAAVIRKNISGAQPSSFVDSVTYDGDPNTLRPSVALVHDGASLDKDGNYTVEYVNADAISIDNTPAQAVITADPFSERVYGTKTLDFTVLPGSCEVSTYKELENRTSDIRAGTNYCNWKKITLTQNIEVEFSVSDRRYITVQPNTVLHIGSYKLGSTSLRYLFTIENNGVVELEYLGGFKPRDTYKGAGTCIGYISEASAIEYLSERCDKLILTKDVTDTSSAQLAQMPHGKLLNESLTFDLGGHTLSLKGLHFNLIYGSILVTNGTINVTTEIKVYQTGDGKNLTFSSVTVTDTSKFVFGTPNDKNNVLGITFD